MMILRKIYSRKVPFLLSLFLTIGFFVSGCSDEFTSVGNQLLNKENSAVKVIDSVTDTIPVSQVNFKQVQALGNAYRLLVGRHDDIAAFTLLKFDFNNSDLADALKKDSITVISAKMKLYPHYTFGDTLSSFGFQAHRIDEFWDPFQFTSDSLSRLNYSKSNLLTSVNTSDTPFTYGIDPATVLEWMKNDAADTGNIPNHGLLLEPERGINKILGFYGLSYINLYPPEMEVIYTKAGSAVDTIIFESVYDAHVVTGPDAQPAGTYLNIQGGISYNSRIYFDLSMIPKTAVINSAELVLTSDTVLSKYASGSGRELKIYAVLDSSKNTYSTSGSLAFSLSGNTYTAKLTSYVAVWHAQKINKGIVIAASDQLNNIDKFVLYGFDAPPEKRPRLKIIYSVFN